ncbi:hypothetical protein, partial [Pseudarthrobacter sp. NPDC092076]|uniref:hypothetical protein n=1 Tax=Pseudarthrobacter sp. NPDC092076 TaxID=3364409 RepID=UPI00381950AA
MGSVRTSILEDLDVYPRTSRRPSTTPSTAKSHFIDCLFGGFLDAFNLLDKLRRRTPKDLANALYGLTHVDLFSHRLPLNSIAVRFREKIIDCR